MGVKELCSKGVKTLAFSLRPLPSGRSGVDCFSLTKELKTNAL